MREQSLMKSLFFGVIDEGLIFPGPEPQSQRGRPPSTRCSTAHAGFSSSRSTRARIDREAAAFPETSFAGLKELGAFGMGSSQSYGGIGLSHHRLRPGDAGDRRLGLDRWP